MGTKCRMMMGVIALFAVAAQGQDYLKPDTAALAHWRDLRFGMFIHWGPVSLTGHEIGWSRAKPTPIDEYDNLYKRFDPTKFNADEWVSIAKAAGMKYIVLTTKHHDGFCLWDTKYTDYNIMNSPFKRDVVKELSDACKKQGIAFGTYYSVTDWYNKDWPVTSPAGRVKRETSDLDAYEKYLQNQITELITKYGPLITMWNDVPAMYGKERGLATIQMVRKLQPNIIVNNRTGAGGDYDTPEQKIGGFNMDRPWETCMTIGTQWSWKPDDRIKSLEQCMQTLIMTAGGDGNLLFNVGPMSTGEIEPDQVARLKEMGAWLQKYGESVYGTRGGPWKPGKDIASTRKGNAVYLHILRWTGDSITLRNIPRKITGSSLLTGGKVEVKQTEQGVVITVPAGDRQKIDTLVKLELEGSAMDIAPVALNP